MLRLLHRATRTDTLFSSTSLFGSARKASVCTVPVDRATLIRISTIVFGTTALGSMIFQCMTFALPKIFDERLASFATTPSEVGGWAFLVFAAAAFAQLVVGYLIDRHSARSEEHTSELQSLMRISYAVFCLKKKNRNQSIPSTQHNTK